MNRAILLSSVTAAGIGFAVPSFSAEPVIGSAKQVQPAMTASSARSPAASSCATDIRRLSTTMQKARNWIGGSEYGYGYPVYGYGYGFGYPVMGYATGASTSYFNARPGYEVRNLLVAANILAENGQQQACEAVLGSTRTIYSRYTADFHEWEGSMDNSSGWQQQQIAAAVPVAGTAAAVRSDQLLDTEVRDAHGDALGSAHDLVIDPKTGKIAYLILARGGIFGFDERFVPVPWNDFKISPNADILVLDTTKVIVAAAPTATDAQFRAAGQFAAQSQKVDAYWATSFPMKAASK